MSFTRIHTRTTVVLRSRVLLAVRHNHSSHQPLRILALPLARSPTDSSGKKPLIYWHISQRYARKGNEQGKNQSVELNLKEPASWAPYAIEKTAATWLSWGEKPEEGKDGWAEKVKGAKYWVWSKGEGLMDRIEAEEWALKSINPALPAIPSNADSSYRIPIIFPSSHPSLPSSSTLPDELRAHLASRIPHHKRLLIRSLILLPFTIPVAALPIIPNLPGFYVAFRAYSHWKALQGAKWLSEAVGEAGEAGKVEVVESDALAGCLVVPSADGSFASSKPISTQDASNTAPDSTSTPSSQPTGAPLSVEFSGETMREKTTEMLNLTHGGAGSKQAETEKASDDGVNHSSSDVSHDTTSTPSSLVHPSQRSGSSKTFTESTIDTAQQKVTSSTPQFVSATSEASSKTAQDRKVDANIYFPTSSVPQLVKAFDLSPHEVVDVTRAVMQARIRWVKALKESDKTA
ncbi:hypothetical protein QFC21_003149 [Naganishia friedmannii]|uniref:Uncharacterized protein n=1 Tax=Naganishia friedmannii TaxID=89922 RepID=A0ACC2VRY1_9TREE|nr:hypothetical protein QFC21_003149 [Naganishia friedmannii]